MSPALVLTLALLGISLGGPLTRLAHAHPLAIAVWRIGLSLVLIAIALVVTGSWRQWARLDRRGAMLGVGAGVMLAFHFWSWNASLAYTTVAASVMLVNTQPVIVAVLSTVLLREAPGRRQWIGIAIAMIGAFVIAAPDVLAGAAATGGRALLGDLLAVVGAVTAALYFLGGRQLRATLDIWPYVALVYGTAFLVLVALALVVGAPLSGYAPRELTIFAGLALGPMLLGHTGFNWALRFFPAFVVNLALLGEPVGATLLAATLPGINEVPGVATFAGGALVLVGIYVTAKK